MLLAAACGDARDTTATAPAALNAVCIDPTIQPPDDAFVCGETTVAECGADPDEILVPLDRAQCAAATLTLSDRGPFEVGTHEVIVRDAANSNNEVCRATLEIEDTTEPTYTEHEVALWPPNHKFHTIEPSDCVTVEDTCDDDVEVVFSWASSDEVENGRGDGNHAPDIRNLGCDSVELRAERAGPQNGRVYHLGWVAFDDDGNTVEGVCVVRVQHDQSGRVAVDDGEAYRIEAPADCGQPETQIERPPVVEPEGPTGGPNQF